MRSLQFTEVVWATSEVIRTKAQLLVASWLAVLGWMFKEKFPYTHRATDTTWSKWIAVTTQWAQTGNRHRSEILEVIVNWPKGENFGLLSGEEKEKITCAEDAPLHNQLPENEKQYALL